MKKNVGESAITTGMSFSSLLEPLFRYTMSTDMLIVTVLPHAATFLDCNEVLIQDHLG